MIAHVKKYVVRITIVLLILLDSTGFFTYARRIKRVIEGTEVDCGTQPQVASLRNASTQQHLCGAIALSSEYALTAAHCVYSLPEHYFLQFNNYCVQNDAFPRASVLDIITHDLYDRKTRSHDIALLRMILWDDIIRLNYVILPSSSFGVSGKWYPDNLWADNHVRAAHGECTLYGYGTKDVNIPGSTEKLNAGKLKIVSLDECTSKLGQYVAPAYNSGMMCAVGDGVDACQGDSGSPLICDGIIQGLCSYGSSCGVDGIPGVYTGVGPHLHWIHDVMRN